MPFRPLEGTAVSLAARRRARPPPTHASPRPSARLLRSVTPIEVPNVQDVIGQHRFYDFFYEHVTIPILKPTHDLVATFDAIFVIAPLHQAEICAFITDKLHFVGDLWRTYPNVELCSGKQE